MRAHTPCSSQNILELSITEIFGNIHFVPHSYSFWLWMRFVIFQINTNFLIAHWGCPLGLFIGDIFRNIHFFLLVLIHSSFICNKIGVFIAKFFKNPFFTTFLLVLEWVRCAIFQMNTDFLMS